jgi:apolipoprotein D and lipocalin family protein
MNKNTPNSILKVRFAPAFLSFIPQAWGDYQIIALSPDYTDALVGDAGRESLWVTFRSPTDGRGHTRSTPQGSQAQSFDVSRLQKTRQSGI